MGVTVVWRCLWYGDVHSMDVTVRRISTVLTIFAQKCPASFGPKIIVTKTELNIFTLLRHH